MLNSAFVSEFFGTATMVLLGGGVIANVELAKTKGQGSNFLMISFGWGFAVFVGVYMAFKSGANLSPAVTLAQVVAGKKEFASGVPINLLNTLSYLSAQFLGAFVGAVVMWFFYRNHFDMEENPKIKLGAFATVPTVEDKLHTFFAEFVATYILVAWILFSDKTPSEIGPLAVSFAVVGIVASLGGVTGCALNPARDLAPRIAHAILPIKGKGDSGWGYAWVPICAPLCGAVAAGLSYQIVTALT